MLAIPPVCSRCGPRCRRPGKLHADKGYDFLQLCRWLTSRRITPRITPRGETQHRLVTTRWKADRGIAWLGGRHRVTGYECHCHLLTGLHTLTAALTCYKHLAKITTRNAR